MRKGIDQRKKINMVITIKNMMKDNKKKEAMIGIAEKGPKRDTENKINMNQSTGKTEMMTVIIIQIEITIKTKTTIKKNNTIKINLIAQETKKIIKKEKEKIIEIIKVTTNKSNIEKERDKIDNTKMVIEITEIIIEIIRITKNIKIIETIETTEIIEITETIEIIESIEIIKIIIGRAEIIEITGTTEIIETTETIETTEIIEIKAILVKINTRIIDKMDRKIRDLGKIRRKKTKSNHLQ